jgi:hypothetical protein
MISVVDVHEVEANAQTRLLVPRIHEYLSVGRYAFLCAIYSLYLYAHPPFRLLLIIHVLITTCHDFDDTS